MNKQYAIHSSLLYTLSSFLMLVNKNTAVHCLFMLVHCALTNVNKYNFRFLKIIN